MFHNVRSGSFLYMMMRSSCWGIRLLMNTDGLSAHEVARLAALGMCINSIGVERN